MVSSEFDVSVWAHFLSVSCQLLIKQRDDSAVKFTHCAVYCVALSTSGNFINSVSFYSLLIRSLTNHRGAGKFVPPVKESICLLDELILRK